MAEQEYDAGLFPDKESAASANAVWTGGKEHAKKSQPIGSHNVNIDLAELGRSTSSDRLQIHYALTIVSGESKGVTLHKYDGLETEQQASITQQQLQRLGIKTDSVTIDKLPAVLLGLTDKKASITTKKNGEYFNIYFNRLLGEAIGDAAGSTKPKF